jgi:hydrogenase-4 component H
MIATIKEVLICLRAGRVTLPYPFVPVKAPPRFRGRPAIDGAKCLGCGACAEVCPPRLITVSDEGGIRRVSLNYSRCTYCARCQEICPVGSMTCTEDFETGTAHRDDLSVSVELDLAKCKICATPFITHRLLAKMIAEYSPPWMNKPAEPPDWFWHCPRCRLEKTGEAMERSIKRG